MAIPQVTDGIARFAEKLEKSTEHFKSELASIRAGRANPQVLSKIIVNYYGTPTPLTQMANISVPEARVLSIALWDQSALKEASKAILASDLGLNPVDDGRVIRLVFPQLTEERRKDLIKGVRKTGEDTRVAFRNERRDVMENFKRLKKDGLLGEDELSASEKEVQKVLDKFSAELDKLITAKEKEITEI